MLARPLFANAFPRTPELDALVDDFSRGDYARVRMQAPLLERASDDDAVKRASRTLAERTKPDPLAVGLLALGAILLVVLATFWIANGRPPPGEGPPSSLTR
jgi:hypothetical protein